MIKNLDLELGYRFSDFNTAGGHSTYKALFTWKALDRAVVPRRLPVRDARTQRRGAVYRTDTGRRGVPEPGSLLGEHAVALGQPGRQPEPREGAGSCAAPSSATAPRCLTRGPSTAPNRPRFRPRLDPPHSSRWRSRSTKGNPKVGPETGKTWTLGAVHQRSVRCGSSSTSRSMRTRIEI